MKLRVPTEDEYRSHDGLHYHQLWRSIGDYWVCPGCGRNKYQIMKWTKRNPNSLTPFMGWVAALHTHHDHSIGFFEQGRPRFSRTIICGQCNSSEGAAKRSLKLPANFSFSPEEIRKFVKSVPHGKHKICLETASSIYNSLVRVYFF